MIINNYKEYKHLKNVIYKITSPSGKIYIGQAQKFYNRMWAYENLQCKPQRKLYHSLLKYGFHNHKIEVIENDLEDNINERETYYIKLYNCVEGGLNICHEGRSAKGLKRTEETKRKMSESRMGKPCSMKGKKHSEESRKNMSIGAKKRGISIETRAKITASLKGRKQSLEQRIKQSERMKLNHPFKGGKHTEQAKLKMAYTKVCNKLCREMEKHIYNFIIMEYLNEENSCLKSSTCQLKKGACVGEKE